MAVPNTTTFTLQDVVDEINGENPTVNTLQESFTNSTDAKFDIAYKGDKDRQYNFRNYDATGSITLTPDAWLTDKTATPKNVDVTADAGNSWTATVVLGESWLSVNYGTGTGNGTFQVVVTVNDGDSNRVGHIYVTNDTPTEDFGVTQHWYMLSVNPDEWIADPPGDTQGIAVETGTVSIPYTATVTTGGSWITIVSGGTGTGSGTVNLSVPANHTDNPRSGVVTVEIDNPPGLYYDKTIDVDQAIDPWLTASPDPWNASAFEDDQTIIVDTYSTNGWNASVTLGGAWLSIFKGGSGTGDGNFILMATENTGGPRSGECTITSSASNFIVNVEQAGV